MRSCLLLSALAAVSTASIGNGILESNSTTIIDDSDWPDTTTDTNSVTRPPFIGPSHILIFPSSSISARPSSSLAKLPASRSTLSRRSDGTFDRDQDILVSISGRDLTDDPDGTDDGDDEDSLLSSAKEIGKGIATKLLSAVSQFWLDPSTTKSSSTAKSTRTRDSDQDPTGDPNDSDDDDDDDDESFWETITDGQKSSLKSRGSSKISSLLNPTSTESEQTMFSDWLLPSSSFESTMFGQAAIDTRTRSRLSSSLPTRTGARSSPPSRSRTRQTSTFRTRTRTRTRSRSSRLSITRSSSSSQSVTASSSSASPTTTMTSTVNSTSATTRTLYSDGFPTSTTTVIRLVEPSSPINASSTVLVVVQPHTQSTTTILSTISTVSLQVSPTTSSTRRSSVRSSTSSSPRSSVRSSTSSTRRSSVRSSTSTSSSRRSSVRSSKSSSRRPSVHLETSTKMTTLTETSTKMKTLTKTTSPPRSTKSTKSKKSTKSSTKTSTSQDLTVILDVVSVKTTTARPSNVTVEVVSTETTTARASTFLVEVVTKPTRQPTRSSMPTASTSTTTITVYPFPLPTVLPTSSSSRLKTHGTSFTTRGLMESPTHPISLRTRTVARTTPSSTLEGSTRTISYRTKTVARATTTTHFPSSSTGTSELSVSYRIKTKQKSSTGAKKTKKCSSTRRVSSVPKKPASPETTKTITRPSGVRTEYLLSTETKIKTKVLHHTRTKTRQHTRATTRQHTRTKTTTATTITYIGGVQTKTVTLDVDGPPRPTETVTVVIGRPDGSTRTLSRTGPTVVVSEKPDVTITIPGHSTTITRRPSTASTTVDSSTPGSQTITVSDARARQIRGMNAGINDRKLETFKGLGKDRKTVKFPNKHGSDACKAMSKKCKFAAKDDNTVLPCQERLAYEVFQLYEADPNQSFARGEVVACIDQNTNYCASIDWQPWVQKSPKAGKFVEDLMTQRSLNDQDEVPIASVVESMNWMLDSDARLCGETLLTVEKQRHSAGNNLGDMVGRYVLKLGTAPPKKHGPTFEDGSNDHSTDDQDGHDDGESYTPWVKPSGRHFVFPNIHDNGVVSDA
ncbi:hypothetical protein D6D13_02777 [Aureobasidium pullulans]|uniref:Ig-like domain-containing protein n=1 Tax=Aureobasidium pullulans TaxID=5580 RepID=A0A4V6TBN7_AURPU|nr:hypothetical protein D6D13_02777 [Aureobasidium pullulans]